MYLCVDRMEHTTQVLFPCAKVCAIHLLVPLNFCAILFVSFIQFFVFWVLMFIWFGLSLVCILATIPCPKLPEVKNGQWNDSICDRKSWSHPTVCQVICSPGFSLRGALSIVTCQDDGTTSQPNLPLCQGS